MTTTDQRSEALRLADELDYHSTRDGMPEIERASAAELRRLAEENERLKAQAVPGEWKLVPVEFLQGFNDLVHNYSLSAIAPDYYYGVERDAFSSAYARCGEALSELCAMLSAAPQPAAPTQEDARKVPQEVLDALDRMCTPLHESRLSGVTAEADARCMKLIRDYVLSAASTQVETQGWQSIETAPKDGTLIVLGAKNGVWLGKYLPIYQSGFKPDNPWSSMMLNHDHMAERRTNPTQWMPLPPAPSTPPMEPGKKEGS